MIYKPYCRVMKSISSVTYSYGNTGTTSIKNVVSNITSIKICYPKQYKTYDKKRCKVCNYNSFSDCIEHIIVIPNQCKYYLDKIDVKEGIYVKHCCIKNHNGNKILFVDFGLNTCISSKEICNCSWNYYKDYQYSIPINKCRVDKLLTQISDIDFYILPNGNIKVCTCIKFKF